MLDRTWYNTLVDDDGSGLTGSVWDKADVDALMDAIDAELARTDARFASGSFTPVLGSSGGGAPIYSAQQGRYSRNNQSIVVAGRVTISSKGSLAAGGLRLGGFPFLAASGILQSGIGFGFFSGLGVNVASLSSYMTAGLDYVAVTYLPAAGGTATAILDASTGITNSLDLVFGGVYRSE